MSLPLFAVSLPDSPTLLENLRYQTTGLMIVLTVLGGLWILLEISGYFFKQRTVSAPEFVPPVTTVAPEESDALPPALVAVIAAAVHHAIKTPHRIVAIRPASSQNDSHIWSAEGRRQVFASHRTR